MSNALGAVPKADATSDSVAATRPDRLILVYDGDGGLRAMLLDVIKKAVGREDCPLCEIVYSPVGKRKAWVECAARLQVPITEMHRDELPAGWGVQREDLPCVLAQSGGAAPYVLVPRDAIVSCAGDIARLEQTIQSALASTSRVSA